MTTCPHCTSTYNPPVTVPQPLPDKTCFYCCTVLTQETINKLNPYKHTNTKANSANPIVIGTTSIN
jgi:hypothetical protein